MFILTTVIQFAVAAFIIWGLFNEKKLIRFEDKLIAKLKKRFALSHKRQNTYHYKSHYISNDRNCA